MPNRVKSGLGLVFALVLGAGLMLLAIRVVPSMVALSHESESRNTQVIESVTKEQEVVLLSLGIQGIAERSGRSSFLGFDVPGSERAAFMQYTFNAKVGLNGEDVRIVETGEGAYRVTIPTFIFIGHDDVTFRLVAEDNGVLSFVTPEVDTVEMVNSILDDEAQDKYVDSNLDTLKEQAETFYGGIIHGIDPEAKVVYDFVGGR